MSAKAIQPRSRFDRQMARIEQQIVWENSPEAVRRDLERIRYLDTLLAEAAGLQQVAVKPSEILRAIAAQRDIVALSHQIDKETLIDRTYPLLERVSHEDAMRVLPVPEADTTVVSSEDETQRLVAETHEMMRQLLAAGAGTNGDARPGLVLIRGGQR